MKNTIKQLSILNLIFLFVLISCGKTEKDKHPDIPYFPKFKDDVLKLVKVKEIELDLDSTVKHQNSNNLKTRYFVKDSTLFLITFFTDSENAGDILGDKNVTSTVDLVVIKKDKIQHTGWIDDDFKLNFKIDSLNNLTIGKHIFFAKSNYYEQDVVSNFKDHIHNDTLFSHYLDDKLTGYFEPFADDVVIIDRNFESGGVAHEPLSVLAFESVPVYLKYYKIKHKNKVGLTKIYDGSRPQFIKLNDEIYFIKEENKVIDEKNKILKIKIYKIK